jgi:hypothetical protein
LESGLPTAAVEAASSKHRRRDVQPLRADVAAMLAGWIDRQAGNRTTEKLWPGLWYRDAAEMLRVDLAAAGLEYVDHAGRVFDFHALRSQFITGLVQADVHPKRA